MITKIAVLLLAAGLFAALLAVAWFIVKASNEFNRD